MTSKQQLPQKPDSVSAPRSLPTMAASCPNGSAPMSSMFGRAAGTHITLLVLVCIGSLSGVTASSVERRVLSQHVPQAARDLSALDRLASTNRLNLAVGLPLRNSGTLTNLLQQLYDPASPNFRHYLTPEQFTERFGPSEQDYQAVIAFAKANGLRVTVTHPNRVVLDVEGSVADVEKMLHVTMRTYQHPSEVRKFFAPDVEPSLDLAIPVLHISGLDNYSLPRPHYRHRSAEQKAQAQTVHANVGSGPGGNYMGRDFRSAYVPGTSLTGAGQSVGLLQFDGYAASDITYYESLAGIPSIPLLNVLIDGATGRPSGNGGEVEVCLDIQMVASMAPGVSKIIVYMAPNPSPWVDLLNRMANDNLAKQLSCSWGGGSPDATAELIFQQMAAQGQSFFNATGDSDAFTGAIEFPSDSPNITEVGGTTLTTSSAGGAWSSETVWNWGGGIGSSGGISTYYAIPSWQQGISMSANKGSTTMRNVPDVAMTADNVYVRANGTDQTGTGGTSCAAPLWAGFAALVNQQAVANGGSPVGFINPTLYAIVKGTNYTACFRDTTTGNNTWSSSSSKFYATAGYDLCTGLGTPNGVSLINALSKTQVPVPPNGLTITPATGVSASGPAGGPLPAIGTFSLTNTATGTLAWTASTTSTWFTLSAMSGSLVGGGPAAAVTVNPASLANSLPAGTYQGNVSFSNRTTGSVQVFSVALTVTQFALLNGGFETTNFSGWVQSGNTASCSVGSGVNYVHSGKCGAQLGPITTLGYLSQSLSTKVGQTYLVSFWLDSPDGQTPNEFLVKWNGVTLFDQVNIGNVGWTNLQFYVTATGTGTVLQFGFRDDPTYLGLDDISVVPVSATPNPPTVSLQPTNQTVAAGGTATFTSLAAGAPPLAYQWQLNTTNLANATNANLILPGITASQAGYYRVVVTNVYGRAISSNAILAVTTGTTPTRLIRLGGNLAFGSVTVGSSSQKTMTIYNDGNSSLSVSGITYPGGFNGVWSGTIVAGGQQNVTVTFLPVSAANYAGTVSVSSDATGGTGTISISGTGAARQTSVNLALASRGSTITGSNGGNWSRLIDGVTNSYNYSSGFGYTIWTGSPGSMTLDLKGVCTITSMRLLLWDLDSRYFRYRISASRDGATWSVVVDHTGTQYRDRSWQTLNLATPVSARYLRLTGTYGSVDRYFPVIEWQVYGLAPSGSVSHNLTVQHPDVLPVKVWTSGGSADYSDGWNVVDGDTNTVWQERQGGECWWMVLEYRPALTLSNVAIDWGEGSLTNVIYLYSTNSRDWSRIQVPLTNASVEANYLWLIFPADRSDTNRAPIIKELWTE